MIVTPRKSKSPVTTSTVRHWIWSPKPTPATSCCDRHPRQGGRDIARRIRIACDELHDDPTNLDARRILLALLRPTAAPLQPEVLS